MVVLSIVPGAVIGGVIAYLLAWLVMPERSALDSPMPLAPRLARSVSDRKIAGYVRARPLQELLGLSDPHQGKV